MFSLWILILWAAKSEHMNFRCSGLEVLNGLQFKPDSALNIKIHFISLFKMFFFVCFFFRTVNMTSIWRTKALVADITATYRWHQQPTEHYASWITVKPLMSYPKTELPIYTRQDKWPSRVRDRYSLNPGIILSNHLLPATTPLTQPSAYMQG